MSQMSSSGVGSGGATPIQSIVTNAGTAVPLSGVVNIIGDANITTQEFDNNVIISLNNAITVDEFIAGDITISGNTVTSEDGFDITLDPNGLGKVSIPYLSPNSQLSLDSSKNIVASASMTDGQLLIGATGGAPAPANLTAGPGIQITNAPGQVTVTNKGVGGGFLRWERLSYGGPSYTQRYQLEPNVGYVSNSWYWLSSGAPYYTITRQPVIMTLPPNDQLSIGDMIAVLSVGGGGSVINANQNQLVTWCQYKYGGGSYPLIYTGNNKYAPAPAFGYGSGIQDAGYQGPTGNGYAYSQAQAIWFIVIGFDGPNNGAVFYIYKTQLYWQVVTAP